jgi:hypothetical protein
LTKLPLHTLNLSIFPVLALLAANVSQVLFADTVRMFAAASLLALILVLAFRVLARDWHKAGLLASLVLALFFSYGHLFSVLQGFSLGPVLIGRTAVLLPLWGSILIFSGWWIMRQQNSSGITFLFNVVSLFLLVFPLYTVVGYYVRAGLISNVQKEEAPVSFSGNFDGEPPDVYYIILDMHARSDVLKALYGYDDTWFIGALEQRGFYIASQSTSNYSSTLQSLSSSLNMEYINYLEDQYGPASTDREPLGLLLQNNTVLRTFRANGYQLGAFQTDDFYTEFRDLDRYLKPSPDEVKKYLNVWALNAFESLLIRSTALRILYDLDILSSESAVKRTLETPYDQHRLTVLYTIEHLPDLTREQGAWFVFAHIVAPHPPYIFGRTGEKLAHNTPYSLSAPGRLEGGPGIVKLYADQLHYIDTQVLDSIDRILSHSDTPPLIIIQGDHGPVSYYGEDEVEKGNMWEQHAILNAYYFPDGNYKGLYPSITPVNSFRVLLNTYFGEKYDLLPDENYFLPHARPYDFVDVTGRVESDRVIP